MTDNPPSQAAPKAVLALSSQVARGSVGLRAVGFSIERLGVPVWKVPTIWMPWHPGHAKTLGLPPRAPTDEKVFADSLDALVNSPVIGEVGTVLTGYFASSAQVEAACNAIDRMREGNPDLRVVVDPVSADSHGSYVPSEVIAALREKLLPRADLATPNRFEAAMFAGADPAEDNTALLEIARSLPVKTCIITSAFGLMRDSTGVLLADETSALLVEHGMVPGAPYGTGDLFAALIVARQALGMSLETAMQKAASSVLEIVARSVKAGSSELLLAREQASLVSPMAMVQARQMGALRRRA
ncbi:MAG: PfkB family carbohydrate kinase [Cohaesibacteraceae bacterium]